MKKDISEEFASPNSNLRLLFATEAYSMGTDVADIRYVVHVGPPMSLESKLDGLFTDIT